MPPWSRSIASPSAGSRSNSPAWSSVRNATPASSRSHSEVACAAASEAASGKTFITPSGAYSKSMGFACKRFCITSCEYLANRALARKPSRKRVSVALCKNRSPQPTSDGMALARSSMAESSLPRDFRSAPKTPGEFHGSARLGVIIEPLA